MRDALVTRLDEMIAIDEEANDPLGRLPGLYTARKMAWEQAKSSRSAPERVRVTIWGDPAENPALSGLYEGADGLLDAIEAATRTVSDLYLMGTPSVTVEIQRIGD